MNKTVTITNNTNGQSHTFPILESTEGVPLVDIRDLYNQMNLFTYDPGYRSTGSCASDITYIDGEKGILRHRGYPIEELAKKSTFIEVAYLLMNGDLPNKDQLEEFDRIIRHHTMIHDQLKTLYHGFRRDSHPMSILCGVIGAMAAFYPDSLNMEDPQDRMIALYRLIAKVPTAAAMAYKYSMGQPFIDPHNGLTYPENFLYMCHYVTPFRENYEVKPIHASAIDKILMLHADHEQNASTSTVRLAGSSGANLFACIASGVVSLWGPAHGGANEAVVKMLQTIKSKSNIPEFIERVKNKETRLMGFGHGIYKNFDPRAMVLREACHDVLKQLDRHRDEDNRTQKDKDEDWRLFEIADELERIALEDEYFISRKLYPNVDFYSGIILKALLFPTKMFTVIFAVARTVGWLAHWKEMTDEKHEKMMIGRPRQRYCGYTTRSYTPIEER